MSLTHPAGYAAFLLAVFATAILVTALVLRHLRIIDQPNERSSHSCPTPRGGGLGIVAGSLLAALLILLCGNPEERTVLYSLPYFGLLAAVLLIGGISLHDDIAGRGFASKLLVQLIAALILLACGIILPSALIQPLPGLLVWPLSLLWLIGMTNAYNFMDGLDGMAGSTAVIVAGFFAAFCLLAGQTVPALLASAMAVTAGGFLCFNWPPARIFMGDIGSTFLGLTLAALALLLANSPASTPASLLLMPLLLLHYLFDTALTFCRRLLAGENVTQAHRSHLYQLLQRSGWSHRRVSLTYSLLAILQGTLALAFGTTRLWLPLLLLLPIYTLLAMFLLRHARRHGLLQRSAATPAVT
ncbi:MAG: glycosyltransferase family 4 protein [Sterolibacterium sp.]|nr:glycosyltransferase family 4 protein [Sterolibacterium sp.]MBP9798541.1 glycosyltransferase family 4 protein [Sterolibacterium sp.]